MDLTSRFRMEQVRCVPLYRLARRISLLLRYQGANYGRSE